MVKKTHSYGSLVFILIALPWINFFFFKEYNFIYRVVLICTTIYFADFGSLLPDTDLRSSDINKRYPILFKYIGKKCRHRGETHSLLCFGIIAFLLSYLVKYTDYNVAFLSASIGLLIGYASHLILDLFTKDGIELFYPCKINIFLWRMKTNSKSEKRLCKLLYYCSLLLLLYDVYVLFL